MTYTVTQDAERARLLDLALEGFGLGELVVYTSRRGIDYDGEVIGHGVECGELVIDVRLENGRCVWGYLPQIKTQEKANG